MVIGALTLASVPPARAGHGPSREGRSTRRACENTRLHGPLQLAVGSLLGGVYYGRLGDYDRNVPGRYFADARVREPLLAFQRELVGVELAIGRGNLERTAYTVLLPSAVPQSINI